MEVFSNRITALGASFDRTMTVGTLFNRTLVVLNVLLDQATVVEESSDRMTVVRLIIQQNDVGLGCTARWSNSGVYDI